MRDKPTIILFTRLTILSLLIFINIHSLGQPKQQYLFYHLGSRNGQDATATLDKNITAIDETIKDMHARSGQIGADLDVQYDSSGITVLLLVPVK